tara:strand:+ start:452 stop:580 length:129 start_codon:yes stop_codon:yes gene_type:complete
MGVSKLTSKGQITLPRDARLVLCLALEKVQYCRDRAWPGIAI